MTADFFTREELEKIIGLKVNTFRKWISYIDISQDDIRINPSREKMYSEQAIIKCLEHQDRLDLLQKFQNRAVEYQDISIHPDILTEQKNQIALLSSERKTYQDITAHLSQISAHLSSGANKSQESLQFLLSQNARYQDMISKLLIQNSELNSKMDLLLTESKKSEPVESPQPVFSILGFTISRIKPNGTQTA